MSFSYDSLGRRTSKTVGGVATQFLYDGANALQETQGTTVNPILTGFGIDERFARNDVTGRTYFLTDALGSTIGLSDTTGALREQYSYDPYGNVTQSDTTTGFTNPYQYTGREANTAGLSYYRARYYSPMMGRFIAEDPMGFGSGQNNFYAYVAGDPLDNLDPLGLAVGDKYQTMDEAGIAAVSEYLPASVDSNREYAGVIYQNWDGTYSYTEANVGTDRASSPGDAPLFHTEEAIYHTHGAAEPYKDGENFSKPGPDGEGDEGLSDRLGEPNYLGTPRFWIKKYDPRTRKVTVLCRGF